MTVSELYSHVAQLGFEESLESARNFYNALNRALLQVGAVRPAIKQYIIQHEALEDDGSVPYTEYDLSELVDDFWALESPPILEDEEYTRINQGYEVISNKIILVPRDKQGRYRVLYRHLPAAIEYTDDPATDNAGIDLDTELCMILPYLVASDVWADDEPEKAEYYRAVYQTAAANIQNRDVNMSPVSIRNINGW